MSTRVSEEGRMVTMIRDAMREALEPAGFWVGGTGNVLHVVEVTNPDRFGDAEVTIRVRPKVTTYDGRFFEVDEHGELWINRSRFAGYGVKPTMTGAELRYLPNPPIPDDDDLFLEVSGGEDVLVSPEEAITVAGKRFFSVPKVINAG